MKKFLKTFAFVSSMSIVATIANADQFVRMVSRSLLEVHGIL